MNTQLSEVGLMVVVGAAGLGVLMLAIVRNRVAVATRPWVEAVIAWAFFVLMGVGTWALGQLDLGGGRQSGYVIRIAVTTAVLIGAQQIWRTNGRWDLGIMILLGIGLAALYTAEAPEHVPFGVMVLITVRLVQGREWALFQARAREAVVGRLSHALRTPAAAIRSLADALATGAVEDPAERARFVALIQAEAERLGVGLDRMLRIARRGEALALSRIPLDLAEWSETVEERWHTRLPKLQVANTEHVVAEVDPERLDEAADALIDNAMRYSGGNVTLSITRVGDRAEIAVSDDGPGPTDEIRKRVAAEAAEPLDPSAARGFGLGLWAVGQVARAHDGRLELRDRSTFVLSLPVNE